MKKRALILTAVLTAAALTGGSGYLPVTDGIRSKMIQNVYADAEDSKESADTETSDSVLDQASGTAGSSCRCTGVWCSTESKRW